MKLSKTLVRQIKLDYLSFTLEDKKICDKYNIHQLNLNKLKKIRTFRIVTREWKTYKKCTNCDVWREWTTDHYHRSWKTLTSTCKYCRCLIARNDRKLRPEAHREIAKNNSIKNQERIRAYQKLYRERNKKAKIISNKI